jgi:DNA mismatch repair protein MutL
MTVIGDTGRISSLPAPAKLSSLPERRITDNASSIQPVAPTLGRPTFAFPQPSGSPRPVAVATGSPPPASSNATRAWRFLGLAHGAYALFETSAGLVLLDRRAAHERIWFERLQVQFRSGSVPSQRLLLPVPVELDPIATALLLDRLVFFNNHGFEIVEFGRNFFRIESVPTWMEPSDAEPFVRDLLGALRDGRLQDKNIEVANDELARLAVAKAIRLPEVAGEAELQGVLAQLFACRSPLTSPSGRPTQIELSHGELARRFQK